jgi:hypothetical protein
MDEMSLLSALITGATESDSTKAVAKVRGKNFLLTETGFSVIGTKTV